MRAAGFCSGCPHNTSTRVPDGSFGIGGTGCHGMAIGLPAPLRETHMFTHMGGEGALWIGMAPFADQPHTFQNMGDGTYSHSGYMAIRAAIAADVNMTFKVLLNGYISMTGGQAIPGGLLAQDMAAQVLAEGAKWVVVVTDDTRPTPTGRRSRPASTSATGPADRDQEELREIPGVTVLIYDQACAAELRRERKRGTADDPDKRVFIHETVCEGCGDCNVQSNCISVEPLETEFGRKRQINQSSCNKDFTCVSGYCPSFVTLYGATPRRKGRTAEAAVGRADLFSALPTPPVADSAVEPYNIVVGGIGGGGVLTIGALLGMAAHLEGKAATVLNESGLAQKNGAVQSHIRIAADPDLELSARIAERSTDLVIGADIVVTAGPGPIATMARGRTRAVVNDDVRPTVAFSRNSNIDMSTGPMVRTLQRATGDQTDLVDANRLATAVMGDAIYTNLFLLGYATQKGWVPVSVAALERAIELNAVSVANNLEALQWGRLAAHDMATVEARANAGDGDRHDTGAVHPQAGRRDARPAHRPAPPVPHRLPGRRLGRPLRTDGAPRRRRRDRPRARPRPARPGRGPQPVQADVLQGRVRGRPALRRPRVPPPPRRAVRGRLHVQGQPRPADPQPARPQRTGPQDRDPVLRRHARVQGPRPLQAAPGHQARRVRAHRAPPRRAGPHRRVHPLLDELARSVTPDNHHLAVQLAGAPRHHPRLRHHQGRDRGAGQGERTAPDPRVSGGDALVLTTSPTSTRPPRGSHAAADCSSFVDHDSGVVFGVVDGVFDVVVGAG